MSLKNIQIYLASISNSDQIKVIPPIQTLLQLWNFMSEFKKTSSKDLGFFEYLESHFKKKYPNSYQKTAGVFFASIYKHGKTGGEPEFFAKLIDENCSHFVITFLDKTMTLLKKKSPETVHCRSSAQFKSMKLNIQDIIKYIKQIFRPYKKILDNLEEKNLQYRIRDYMINYQPNMIMETTGLAFLEIVKKEAELIKKTVIKKRKEEKFDEGELEEIEARDKLQEKNSNPKNIKQEFNNNKFSPKSYMSQSESLKSSPIKPQTFYKTEDIMGSHINNNSSIKKIRQQKREEELIMEEKKNDEYIIVEKDSQTAKILKKNQRKEDYEKENEMDISFNDLYNSINDQERDSEFLELIQTTQKLDTDLKNLDDELDQIPAFAETIENTQAEMIQKISQRYYNLLFMRKMLIRIINHESDSSSSPSPEQEKLVDLEMVEDFDDLENFYKYFHFEIENLVQGKTNFKERFSIEEYFDSATKSKFDKGLFKKSFEEKNSSLESNQDFSKKNSVIQLKSPQDIVETENESVEGLMKSRLRAKREKIEKRSKNYSNDKENVLENSLIKEKVQTPNNFSKKRKMQNKTPNKVSNENSELKKSTVSKNLKKLANYVKSPEFKGKIQKNEDYSDEEDSHSQMEDIENSNLIEFDTIERNLVSESSEYNSENKQKNKKVIEYQEIIKDDKDNEDLEYSATKENIQPMYSKDQRELNYRSEISSEQMVDYNFHSKETAQSNNYIRDPASIDDYELITQAKNYSKNRRTSQSGEEIKLLDEKYDDYDDEEEYNSIKEREVEESYRDEDLLQKLKMSVEGKN